MSKCPPYRTPTNTIGVRRGYTEPLKKIAEKRGATIRLGTKVNWIYRKDVDGPVLGVEVEKGKKISTIKFKKCLVLASGGFSRDIEMRKSFNPGIVPEFMG
jgi:fumarate reductase flavoprotein subunit